VIIAVTGMALMKFRAMKPSKGFVQERQMRRVGCAALVVVAVAVSGCTGLTDYPAASGGDYYYGSPGVASEYYGAPYYAAPYPPGYVRPYPYGGPWGGAWGGWNRHEWQEHRGNAFRDGGHPPFGQPHPDSAARMPPHPMNPVPTAPRPVSPPPAASPQAAQNKALLDQLGFRPSR